MKTFILAILRLQIFVVCWAVIAFSTGILLVSPVFAQEEEEVEPIPPTQTRDVGSELQQGGSSDVFSGRRDEINVQVEKINGVIETLQEKVAEVKLQLQTLESEEGEEAQKERSNQLIRLSELELKLEEAHVKRLELKKRISKLGVKKIHERKTNILSG